MTSGYKSGGVDLDDIFALYTSGTKGSATGIRVAGQDLADRYQPLGANTKRPDVGWRTGGSDIANRFLGKGGGSLAASNSGVYKSDFLAEPAPTTKSVTGSGNVFASGGSGSYTCTWSHLSGDSGIPTPSANNFSPSFTATVTKNTNRSAVKRCNVSDGITSVNTDMSVTLEYLTSA